MEILSYLYMHEPSLKASTNKLFCYTRIQGSFMGV